MAALHPLVPTIAFCRLLWSWGRSAQPGSPSTSSHVLHMREMQAMEVCPSFIPCIHKTVMDTKCIDEKDFNNNDRNLYYEGEDDCRWVWRSSSASRHSLALSSWGLDQEVVCHYKDGAYQLIQQPGVFHEKDRIFQSTNLSHLLGLVWTKGSYGNWTPSLPAISATSSLIAW